MWAMQTLGLPNPCLLARKSNQFRACGLQVYQGIYAMYVRDFKLAADLFLDSTATFTT